MSQRFGYLDINDNYVAVEHNGIITLCEPDHGQPYDDAPPRKILISRDTYSEILAREFN